MAQFDLELIWASTGDVTNPGGVKYQLGWEAEIPTFQNMNYAMQVTTNNIRHSAQYGMFDWQDNLTVFQGGWARGSDARQYFAHTDSFDDDPTLDTNKTWWQMAPAYGIVRTSTHKEYGLFLANFAPDLTDWWHSSLTIQGGNATVVLNTVNAGTDNLVFGNVGGELVVTNVGVVTQPSGVSMSPSAGDGKRIFHEGHPPTQSEVDDTIPEEPQDGVLYARKDGAWIAVTSTEVSLVSPSPTSGAGQGWYNLEDGILYIDIDDGTDEAQWVPAAPARVPQADAIPFDNAGTGLTATTMQDAIAELAAFH